MAGEVSITPMALVVAVVLMEAPLALLVVALRQLPRLRPASLSAAAEQEEEISARGCLYVAAGITGMVAGLVLIVTRAAIAALVTPGFDIDGFWSYVATTALGLAAVSAPAGAWWIRRRVRRD